MTDNLEQHELYTAVQKSVSEMDSLLIICTRILELPDLIRSVFTILQTDLERKSIQAEQKPGTRSRSRSICPLREITFES